MNDRIRKLNSVLTTEIGALILTEVDFKPGSFATISSVKTAQDLSQARVFVQPFPSDASDYIMKTLDHEKYVIQNLLHKRLHLKILPKISFVADHSGLHVQDIDEALSDDNSI